MTGEPARIEGQAGAVRSFRYYDLVMAAFVAILLLSNIIGAAKPSYIPLPGGGQWSFGAGVLFFPVSYVIGDVLTEVYGYARARRVIWAGFAALAFYGLAGWPIEQLWQVVISQWLIKTAWEALLTPVTYAVVGFLKRREGAEVFDTDTDFSPFARSAKGR